MQLQRRYAVLIRFLIIMVDLILINLGYIIAFLLKFGWHIPAENSTSYLITWPWLTLAALSLFYFYKLYGGYRWRWGEVFAALTCVVFFQAMAAMAISFLLRGFSFPRTVLLLAPLIQLVLLALWRRMIWRLERGMIQSVRAIVVGQPREAAALAKKLEQATGGSIKVLGLVVDTLPEKEDNKSHDLAYRPILGVVQEFAECLAKNDPDQVFVCSALSQEQKAGVVYACVDVDKKVLLVPDLYEIMLSQAKLDQVDDVPIFSLGRLNIPEESLIVKRLMDIVISLVALVITAPLNIL
ncbi:MAG TPA: hypothetical protein DCZ10_06620, partial [Pelotomaculum sp.]|nr:hypothetical protein [Pelotomaculum sp.]